jgi:hypothetical protein
MKLIAAAVLMSLTLLPLCSCTMFYTKQPAGASEVQATPKPLSIPVGKNWQVTEEAPQLSNDSGRLPFQTEQSLQPGIAKPVAPVENRTIETSR